jgi:tetratricopeptide (TPR) repeat protein
LGIGIRRDCSLNWPLLRARWLRTNFSTAQFADEALSTFLKSLEINPRLCVSHYYVGEIMAAKGRYDDAIDSFTTAVIYKPTDVSCIQ